MNDEARSSRGLGESVTLAGWVVAVILASVVFSDWLSTGNSSTGVAPTKGSGLIPSRKTIGLFKDFIFPFAQLCLTATIGVFIAYYLNRRGSRDKVKEIAINTYLEYIDTLMNSWRVNANLSEVALLRRLKTSEIAEGLDFAVSKSLSEVLERRITEARSKFSDEFINGEANVSPFTYRFCFLLGKRFYFKHLLELEKGLTFLSKIPEGAVDGLFSDDSVVKQIKKRLAHASEASAEKIIDQIITDLTPKITQRFTDEFRRRTEPYSNFIADSIDRI